MATDPLIGQTLGPYRVEAPLGSGATGVVYRAEAVGDGALVALKVLHKNLGSIGALERRFEREARVLQKLSHPNIVEIIDFGVADGRTYIAMERLLGETLEDCLKRGPLPPMEALALYEPILLALSEAHDLEIVHRDLKPANVFMLADGTVKLLDFGLAKMLSIEETLEESTLTRKGRIVGTPAYMAPEQITGVFIDVRADVYALGVMLYELLADHRPFRYPRRSQLLRAHLLEPVPPIDSARAGLVLDRALSRLIDKALSKDAGRRFKHGRAMLDAIRALPKDAARLNEVRGESARPRRREGASSAVITAQEAADITEAARTLSDVSGGATDPDDPSIVPSPPKVPAIEPVAEGLSGWAPVVLLAITLALIVGAGILFMRLG